MLIIRDSSDMLHQVKMMLELDNIDLDAYRREHQIPSDYKIDIVHTDGDYAFSAEENGMTVTKVMEDAPCLEEMRIAMMNAMKRTSEEFYYKFCHYCDMYGLNEVDVYKKAGLDRKVFSKIRNPGYRTSKDNVLALGLSLGLRRHELEDLMRSAGYVFDRSDARDVAIENFLLLGGKKLKELDYLLSNLGLQTIVKYG